MAKNGPNELKQKPKCGKFHADSILKEEIFSYLQQKSRYDVISDTRYLQLQM